MTQLQTHGTEDRVADGWGSHSLPDCRALADAQGGPGHHAGRVVRFAVSIQSHCERLASWRRILAEGLVIISWPVKGRVGRPFRQLDRGSPYDLRAPTRSGGLPLPATGQPGKENAPSLFAPARLAILVCEPSKRARYAMRVPHRLKLMPHTHPEDQACAVTWGDLFIERYDPEKSQGFPTASVLARPGEPWHSHWAKPGKYITEVAAAIRSVWNKAASVVIRATTPSRHNQRFLKRLVSGNLPFSRLAVQTRIRCANVTRDEHLTWADREVTAMSEQISAQLSSCWGSRG